eukprot:gene23391-28383_t
MQGSKDNKKDKASKFKGVYRSGKKWKAQHYLGVFDSEVHAAIHYQHFAMQHNRLPVPTALRGKPVAPSNFDEEAPDDSLQPAPAQLRYLAVHIHMLGQLCVGLESHNSGEEAFEK